jgi:hypothetical protein
VPNSNSPRPAMRASAPRSTARACRMLTHRRAAGSLAAPSRGSRPRT